MSSSRFQFWIDRGGTFTDVVARDERGAIASAKLLSDNPEQYDDAAVEGIRRLLGLREGESIGPDRVECVKMGTTVATNALLERKGDRTLLVTTRGFRDALRIGYQNRPRLFDRRIVLPELLYERVIEASERVAADGGVIEPLNVEGLRCDLERAHEQGIRACAIVFMHGYRYTEHERIAAELARASGFEQVSVSHVVSPLLKFVSRGDTCVVDAYLSPILQRYVERIAAQMAGVPIYFMQSNGGLTSAEHFAGKDAVLSGPAGGIVGMAYTARAAGHDRVIGFDMGGTSTDVSHYAGELERSFETEVAGVRMRAPMMNIHTVAAGGGSVLHFDGARLRVGPDSAGANPGPACYRRGGPLTITDANLLLGKLQPEFFPRVFGSAGDEPLDRAIVERGFAELAARVRAESGRALDPEALAEGFIEIAVANMAHAIKKISVARGHDVTRYTLQCFGGAGGQHACRVADALGIERVFIHPLAGVLSAYGMGLADQTALRELAVEAPLDDGDASAMNDALERVCEQTSRALMDQGFAREQLRTLRRVHLRYEGSDGALPIAYDEVDAMRRAFEDEYRKRFGFVTPDKRLIVESVSAEAIAPGEPLREQRGQAHPHWPSAEARVRIYSGGFCEAALHRRHQLQGGARIDGPAVLVEDNATSVVELGWRAEIDGNGNLLLERIAPRAGREVGTEVDPIRLELFNNLFMNIAEQMGLRLQNSAHSVNIKERLDFSCALFDRSGQLIANAPHMPVHLGSMSESIATVIARNPAMQRGDVFALNDPYHGGTHLPDVTVVSPVFDEREERVLFYVASRGHHADIGSITPGSMPPFSTDIAEEGVLLDNVKLVSAGRLCERELLELLTRGPHPARNPEQNLADLRAQIAANEKGADELRAMVRQFGSNSVAAYMQHVQDNAEESVRRAIARLDRAIGDRGRFELTLDNGALIALTVTIDRARRWAVVDFSGSSHQLPNNFNAPRAVTMAAVLYVFRSLVDDEIPLNAGCMKPIEVIAPERSLLNPQPPAAVVAGNVEVSTCVTNALYGALSVLASAQPTMNNFTFGDDRYQYYETIAGGSGAGDGFDGTSVVQTHMTNSRLTDPEILELRFPVRLERFEIRVGSGGAGRFRGGDGATRELSFLRAMNASILSNGRGSGAFGLHGGAAGAPGRNLVIRADGSREVLGHIASIEMKPGDRFVIETPGGGGYGSP